MRHSVQERAQEQRGRVVRSDRLLEKNHGKLRLLEFNCPGSVKRHAAGFGIPTDSNSNSNGRLSNTKTFGSVIGPHAEGGYFKSTSG